MVLLRQATRFSVSIKGKLIGVALLECIVDRRIGYRLWQKGKQNSMPVKTSICLDRDYAVSTWQLGFIFNDFTARLFTQSCCPPANLDSVPRNISCMTLHSLLRDEARIWFA